MKEVLYFIILLILFILFSVPQTTNVTATLVYKVSGQTATAISIGLMSIVFILLAWGVYKLLGVSDIRDNFHFEVTPGKKKCLWAPYKYCPEDESCLGKYCCCRGFHGRPLYPKFKYSSDAKRGKDCLFQGECPPMIKNRASNFYSLADTYNGF